MTMPRQIGREMGLNSNRADSWATASMRNAESFMQIQVRYVTAKLTGCTQPDHGIHVRTINVNLTSVRVHDVADLTDAFFKNAVRRRVSDHQSGELRTMFFGLYQKVIYVDVAANITSHNDNSHAGHLSRRRVRAMG
ncbi:hypothetical protein D3C80_1503170 [compost metagenome]